MAVADIKFKSTEVGRAAAGKSERTRHWKAKSDVQLQERRWNRRRVGFWVSGRGRWQELMSSKTGSSQSKLWEPAFTPGGRGCGEVGLSSAYFKSCQCCKLQNAPLSFLWMILYRVLSAPSKQKVSEISNLNLASFCFFSVSSLFSANVRSALWCYDCVRFSARSPPSRVTLFQEHSWIKQ